MNKYHVTVIRTVHQFRTLDVEAADCEEAEKAALAQAPGENFAGLEKDSEYRAVDCWEQVAV